MNDKCIELLELCEKNNWLLNIVHGDKVVVGSIVCGGGARDQQKLFLDAAHTLLDEKMLLQAEGNSYRVTSQGINFLKTCRESSNHATINAQKDSRSLDGQDDITSLLLRGLHSFHPGVRDTWTRGELIKFCMDSVPTMTEKCQVALQLLTAWDSAQSADKTAEANEQMVEANKQMVTETKRMVCATAWMAFFTFLVCVATFITPLLTKWLETAHTPADHTHQYK